jgi:putative SOS response-associated peptidase YedK
MIMCGRVRLSSDYSEIKIRLKFASNSVAPNFEPDWNKPPTAPMLVAIRSIDGERVPKMMKWGLIPHWTKDDKLQYSTFNARAEEFTTKPAFRDAWARGQRCRTILTCEPNSAMGEVHDRMPVILAENDWPKWVGEEPASEEDLLALLKPCSDEALKIWPVDKTVGNVKNDGSQLTLPVLSNAVSA